MIKYKKLKRYQHGELVDTGEWGLEITGAQDLSDEIEPGEIVEVRKSNGSIKREMIGRIICKKDGYLLCTIDRQGFSRPNYSEIDYREGRDGGKAPFLLY